LATNAPKLWPAVPVSLTADGVVRQALVAVALGDFARQHGADRAVDVLDSVSICTLFLFSSAGCAKLDQLAVETSSIDRVF
jgi:hypothetical protein